MKLSYRGIKYEPQHENVKVVEGEVGGHYRGIPWKIHRYQQQQRQAKNCGELIYRGVHYEQ